MSNIKYLQIFRDAWKIIWKNRFLWWFGFFMFLVGVANPNYFQKNTNNTNAEWQNLLEQIRFQEFIAQNAKLINTLEVLLIIIFMASLILSLLSRGAIIKSIQRILKNKPATFLSGIKDGKKYFRNNFLIIFSSSLVLILCLIILTIPVTMLFSAKAYFFAIPLTILAVLISFPLIVLYKFIQTYACFYTTLADLTPWLAIENAYALFKKNILASLIMSLAIIPVCLVYFLISILTLLGILFILILTSLILLYLFKNISFIVIAIIILVPLIVAIGLFFSVFIAFSQVTWILFFYRIATPKVKEVIIENIENPELEKTAENSASVDAIKTIETKE